MMNRLADFVDPRGIASNLVLNVSSDQKNPEFTSLDSTTRGLQPDPAKRLIKQRNHVEADLNGP